MSHATQNSRTVSEDITTEFPLQDFIDALWYNLGRVPDFRHTPGDRTPDFWEKVIRDASRGRAQLFPFQRKHLLEWIKQNHFHLTANFSTRAKITLQHRMKLL